MRDRAVIVCDRRVPDPFVTLTTRPTRAFGAKTPLPSPHCRRFGTKTTDLHPPRPPFGIPRGDQAADVPSPEWSSVAEDVARAVPDRCPP